MKRLALLLAVLLLVGCAAKAPNPRQSVDTPQPVATACQEGTDRLSIAGVHLREPADSLLLKLGNADHTMHSAKYPMTAFAYGFGTITVWGDGRIFSLDLQSTIGLLGDPWPGVKFGDTREQVLQALAKIGYCPSTSSTTTAEFVRQDDHLTLTFGEGGRLVRAFLVLETAPTDTPSSPTGFYPPDVRTGILEVDKVIGAAAAKDGDTLAGVVRLSKVACTTQTYGMPGQPLCPEGRPDGTLVEVFPSGSCESNFILSQELAEQALRSIFAEPYYVYGVFKLGEPGGEYGARYGVILGTGTEGVGVTLYLDAQGSIVQVVACGGPENMVPQGAGFILLPRGAQLG